jgi:hypothetical protein
MKKSLLAFGVCFSVFVAYDSLTSVSAPVLPVATQQIATPPAAKAAPAPLSWEDQLALKAISSVYAVLESCSVA